MFIVFAGISLSELSKRAWRREAQPLTNSQETVMTQTNITSSMNDKRNAWLWGLTPQTELVNPLSSRRLF
ncbi:hypothetical protein QUB80_18065 [Chlorogloeopsis sp. ULAP01]|uniref:hypothetical protein n=1 Tax=Chlorogloeopsis sp. ULAP01 TaxID=3056483 RepID=UPI0025AAC72B|nr:hypothetical protein [Chlorogloeopsis sp. ULAP01]MDM9382607.1 hypothetical protein [Chlorogloeopsis sp. ULAP01]